MSRVITADAHDAFDDERPFRKSNTEVTHEDGVTIMYLFGNAIAKREGRKLHIRTAGYATTTTKERLNGLAGVDVYTSRKVLHLNGQPWEGHEDWTEIKAKKTSKKGTNQ